MAEIKKKAEFKKEFYIKWNFSDWLNDANVRMLKPEHKGFWMDLICQMALFFPYGHCSKISIPKLKKLKPELLKNFSVEDLVNQNSNGGVDLLVELQVELLLEEQLGISENMEDKLHFYLPYTPDQVRYHLQGLEDEGVYSRTPGGIIYSRRMVRDFRKRVTAFKNGRNGGNPQITGRTPKKRAGEKASSKSSDNSLVGDLVNQNPNPGVGNLVKPFPNYNYNYNSKEEDSSLKTLQDSRVLQEGGLGETIEKIPISEDFKRIASQKISIKNFSDQCPDEGWEQWARFIQLIEDQSLQELYIAKFPNPNDFYELVRNEGFTESKWLPTLRRILATGIKPEQNLKHRIPQFMGYIYRKKAGNGDLHTGDADFQGMKTW